MKPDYTALDSAIKEAMAAGPMTFRKLESNPLIKARAEKAANKLNQSADGGPLKTFWRVIESRLSDMRKKDVIDFHGNAVGWSLKEKA